MSKSSGSGTGKKGGSRPDAVIVGAGIIGCGIALALGRKGYEPLVVERSEDSGLGSTRLSTAVIRQRFGHATTVALALEGMRTWQRWGDFLNVDDSEGMASFKETGVAWLLPTDQADTSGISRMMAHVGAVTERVKPGQLADRFPTLQFPEEPGSIEAIVEPEAGYVDDPWLATHNLRVAAEAAGARFIFGTRVTEITNRFAAATGTARQVTGVVTDKGGAISSPVVVNAAGPASAGVNLLARCPLSLTTAPLRQQVLEGPAPAVSHARSATPVFADLTAGYYCRPDPARLRIGSIDPRDEVDFQSNPDKPDEVVSSSFRKAKLAAHSRRMPSGKMRSIQPLVGLYDVTVADWTPILDRTDLEGYFVAIGTSGAWFKGGPTIGFLMAELIDAIRSGGQDHDSSPVLIRLPITRNLIDMSFFSRLRRPHRTGGLL